MLAVVVRNSGIDCDGIDRSEVDSLPSVVHEHRPRIWERQARDVLGREILECGSFAIHVVQVTTDDFAVERGRERLDLVAVGITVPERRAAVNASDAGHPNLEPGFFPHFTYDGHGRR